MQRSSNGGLVITAKPVSSGAPSPPPVLVIKLGALGDLMQSLDAFQAIRAHHPGQPLTLLTAPAFASFARAMPWFDQVWTDRRARLWRVWGWLPLVLRLRRAGFARVYDLQSNQRTAFYFRSLWGARPEWSGQVRGCSHPRPDFLSMTGHNHDRLLQHVHSAGVPNAGPADLSWLDAPVDAFSLPPHFALLIPGCSPHRPYKRWPAERYAALVRWLAEQGLGAVIIGTKADQEAAALVTATAPTAINLCGCTTLLEVGGIARRAALAVGNDTGPLFIASQLGVPALMLMSRATIAHRMHPLGPRAAWLQRDDLADLTVGAVIEALRRFRDSAT